ncbi:MAG TPA: hypothetical protein VF054_04470 [Micromonosporaceae bacterium]
MRGMWWMVAAVVVVVLVAMYLTWLTARLDRLAARCAAAHAALDAHLVRRAAAASQLADALGRPELKAAARAALEAHPDDRELVENDLTRALRALPYPPDAPTLAEVSAASRQVALTRQVHNDLVRDALAVRRRRLVRLLRLGRRHAEPRYFDVDDPILDTSVPVPPL